MINELTVKRVENGFIVSDPWRDQRDQKFFVYKSLEDLAFGLKELFQKEEDKK